MAKALHKFVVLNRGSSGGGGAWPSGADGALLITTGNTVTLAAGAVKDYSSIQIDAGGTLQIDNTSGGSAWTIIGCSGNCTINGQILLKKGENTGGTFTATAPDAQALTYTITQRSGGAGGTTNLAGGGLQLVGNAGGGAFMGTSGGNASSTKGGDGAPGAGGTGGVGANIYSGTGGAGTGTQAGGGGGSRGRHGQALYLKVAGTYSGSGTIDASGDVGGGGGIARQNANASGGGGGAAGGSGGKIEIRYHAIGSSPTLVVTGGTGGTGGIGWAASNAGAAGSNGTTGNNGTTDVAAY